MSWRPGLVALDVDGGALERDRGDRDSSELVSPAVSKAVARVVGAGVPVVLVGQRSIVGLADVAALLGLPSPGWLVGSSGAVVATYSPPLIDRGWVFNARPVVEAALARLPEAMIAVEDSGFRYQLNRPFPEGELFGEAEVLAPEKIGFRRATRMVIGCSGGSVASLAGLAAELDVDGADYVLELGDRLELSSVGVSRATGVAYVAERLGVSGEDVVMVEDSVELGRWF